MPASPSRNRALKSSPSPRPPPAPKRLIWTIASLALLTVVVVVLLVLPASLAARFLPAEVHADDFSGSIWHGSSGHITVSSRPAGALEWQLHLSSLLSMAAAADVRWVKDSVVIDGEITVNAQGFEARNVRGGGPLDDLRDLGLPPGWSGNSTLDLKDVKGSFQKLDSAAGTIEVSALSSTSIAHGADLGGYVLTLDPTPVDGSLVATVKDTGGPLEVQAEIHYTPGSHSGLLSGTIKEREGASAALREELNQLAQMKARDNLGRIPVELEFAM